jgi:hypothetical protein
MAANDYNFSLFALIVGVDSYFHIFDYAVYIRFIQAILASPAKIHTQAAIFRCQAALAKGTKVFIILIDKKAYNRRF